MFLEILFSVLISSAIALDRTAIIQIMISQPIVASPLIGYFLGDFVLGLEIGIAIQLLWLASLQIGAAIVPNSSIASLLISIVSILLVRMPQMNIFSEFSLCGIVFIVALPLLSIEEKMDTFVRKNNYFWTESAFKRFKGGNISLISLFNLGGTFFFYLKNVLFLLVAGLLLTQFLPHMIILLPAKFISSFGLFFKMIPVIGVAAVLAGLLSRKYYYLFVAGVIAQIVFISIAIFYGE